MNDLYSRAPHRPAAQPDVHSPHAALLIDFDNVTMGIRSNLGQELRKLLDSDIIRGKVSVQRAYADWRRYPQYIASLSEASIDLIFAPAYGSTKKNATDIRLAIDALEIVFIRPEIGTFILLSGDSDFSSLVLKLKEYGKYVIGVGIQESSSDLLVQNCDEYYSYNSLSGLTSATDMKNIEKHDPWELAAKSIRRMTERGDVMRSDRFKQVMLELDPSFSERSIGFSKFNRFLTEAASKGILDLHKAANGQFEVAPGARAGDFSGGGAVAAAGRASDRPAPDRPRDETRSHGRRGSDEETESRPGRRGRSRSRKQPDMSVELPPDVDEDRLRKAYDLLRSVVEARAGKDGVRDSEVKRQMLERDASFDEAVLGFRKFNRFLRQAHDEEVINLERMSDGNYRILPAAAHGAGSVPSTSGEPKPDAAPREERETRPGRRDRKERGRRGRSRDRTTDAEAVDREEEAAPHSEGSGPEAAIEAEPRPAEPQPAEPRPAGPQRAESSLEEGRRPTQLLGRRRKPTRPAPGSRIVPGPVDEGGVKEGPGDGASKPEAKGVPAPRSRSTGPFRRGSRSGRKPSTPSAGEKPQEVRDSGGEAPGGDATAAPGPEAVQLIEHMSRGYQGVGRRTAERLVEEFGKDVFEVIDNDPEQIESLLPKGRAQAVIDGRRAEREAEGHSGD